jgi:hypothetical protein
MSTEEEFNNSLQETRVAMRVHQLSTDDIIDSLIKTVEDQEQHSNDDENPHGLKASDVELGNVQNRSPAQVEDVENMVNLDRMATPLTAKMMIESGALKAGVIKNPVRAPRILVPMVDSTIPGTQGFTFEADAYQHVYSRIQEGTVKRIGRMGRRWQVDTFEGDFTNPILDVIDTTGSDSRTFNESVPQETRLKVRCQDISIDEEYGPWSAIVPFYSPVGAASKPVVSYDGDINQVLGNPTFTSTPHNMNTGDDPHVSTYWYIYKDGEDNPISSFFSNSPYLTYEVVPALIMPDAGGNQRDELPKSSDYEIEVMYLLQSGTQVKSDRLSFRTADVYPYLPGPTTIETGNSTYGVYGPSSMDTPFITTAEFRTLTGYSGGSIVTTDSGGDVIWVKLSVDGQIAYLPMFPLFKGSDYSSISNAGFLGDGKEVIYNGTPFQVRFLKGFKPDGNRNLLIDRVGQYPDGDPVVTEGSEWDKVMSVYVTYLKSLIGNVFYQPVASRVVTAESPTNDITKPFVIRGKLIAGTATLEPIDSAAEDDDTVFIQPILIYKGV